MMAWRGFTRQLGNAVIAPQDAPLTSPHPFPLIERLVWAAANLIV
jgi:hypothetical protein